VKLGTAFVQTLAVQVVQSAASLLAGILIARALGPSEQGRYAVFAAAVGVGALLVALGQFQGNVIAAAERPGSGRLLLVRSVLQGLGVAAVLGIIALSGGAVAPPVLRDLGVVFTGVLCVEALAQMVRGVNLGQHDVMAFNAGTFLQRLLYLALVAVLVQSGRLALPAIAVVWMIAAASSVALGGALAWRRSEAAALSWPIVWTGWGTDIVRSLRALVTVVLSLVLIRTDVYMLGPMLGLAVVGQMSVAVTLAEWLWYVPSILNNLLFAASAADTQGRRVEQIARVTRSLVALLVPLGVVLMVVARPLVHTLYGPAYGQAVILFTLLVPGVVALALHLVVDSYFAGLGFPAISLWAPALALVVKGGLNLIVVPQFGAPGAACVSSVVYMALLTAKVVALARRTKLPVGRILSPSWRDLTAGVGAATASLLRGRA
jgi:O-antigen/teichoic acid export membrane protein